LLFNWCGFGGEVMDIVERLRRAAEFKNTPERIKILDDAANEIERLRNNKKDLLAQVQMLRQSMDWIKSLIFGIEQRLMTND
jgi:hypothetical protein